MRTDRLGDYTWIPLFYFEFRRRHWGLEIGVSFGAWIPAEYSLHLNIGPFAWIVGIEKEYHYGE